MDELISIEKLIEEAKAKGVDFGKGDPYNRLRYYTKIGWLPHMVRKKDEKGNTRGHYVTWAIDRLVTIETLKAKGATNDDISKELKVKTKFQNFIEIIKTKETRGQIFAYSSITLLLLILGTELGIIRIGANKADLTTNYAGSINATAPKQLIDSGSAFVPKNQKKLFIQTPLVKNNYKVYITFTQDYSPAARYWIAGIDDYKGFTLELDTSVFQNAEFNWWITN